MAPRFGSGKLGGEEPFSHPIHPDQEHTNERFPQNVDANQAAVAQQANSGSTPVYSAKFERFRRKINVPILLQRSLNRQTAIN